MEYTILVIDDDEAMHYIVKDILKKEYKLVHAKNTQDGINALAEKKIDLVLSDIHMPGMTGLEFLEAIKKDTYKKEIPFLIMTSLPTYENEQKALELGAKDFIKKEDLLANPESLLERVERKLVANLVIPDISSRLTVTKKKILDELFFEIENQDFMTISQGFCKALRNAFELDHISFWKVLDEKSNLIVTGGSKIPPNYDPKSMINEDVVQRLLKTRKPYLTNNIFNSKIGTFMEGSREEGYPAEIGVPVFALTERDLIRNKMKIPPEIHIFGFMLIKRSEVFSSKEFLVLSKIIVQSSTLLWRLYIRY